MRMSVVHNNFDSYKSISSPKPMSLYVPTAHARRATQCKPKSNLSKVYKQWMLSKALKLGSVDDLLGEMENVLEFDEFVIWKQNVYTNICKLWSLKQKAAKSNRNLAMLCKPRILYKSELLHKKIKVL